MMESLFAEAERQANDRNGEVITIAILLPVGLIEEVKQIRRELGRSQGYYNECDWRRERIMASERLEVVYQQLYQWLKELPPRFQKELFAQIEC